MPKREIPPPRTNHVIPGIRAEVRFVCDHAGEVDAASMVYAASQDINEHLTREEIADVLFALTIGAANAAANELGLPVIFEVIDDSDM